jgi:hypothetical protein
MRIFDRYLRVVLIKQGVTANATSPAEFGNYSYTDVLQNQEFIEIPASMRVDVKIDVASRAGSDSGHVTIWNPNKKTMSFINSKSGGMIEIFAGYGQWIGLVYRGNIGGTNIVQVDTDGPDTKIKYSLGSYTDRIASAFFRGSFSGPTYIRTIIHSALEKNGIPHTGLENIPSITVSNFTWSGKVTELIKTLSDSYGLRNLGVDIFYEKGNVVVQLSTPNTKTVKVHTISSETGLIDTPRWSQKNAVRKFKFKSVVNPELSRGSVVEIFSSKDESVNGQYVVEQIEYDMSNYGGEFQMEVECRERTK